MDRNNAVNDSKASTEAPPMALRAKQAAEALGISERLLWAKTNAGEIPHIHVGRAVLYPVDALRQWLTTEARRNARH